MTWLKNLPQRVWLFFYRREWAGMLGFVTFLLVNAESISELISGEVEKAGDKFDFSTLIIIVATLAIRWNVWSRAQVEKDVEQSLMLGRAIGHSEASDDQSQI